MEVKIDADELCELRAAKKKLGQYRAEPCYMIGDVIYVGKPPTQIEPQPDKDARIAELEEENADLKRGNRNFYKSGDFFYALESDAISSLASKLESTEKDRTFWKARCRTYRGWLVTRHEEVLELVNDYGEVLNDIPPSKEIPL